MNDYLWDRGGEAVDKVVILRWVSLQRSVGPLGKWETSLGTFSFLHAVTVIRSDSRSQENNKHWRPRRELRMRGLSWFSWANWWWGWHWRRSWLSWRQITKNYRPIKYRNSIPLHRIALCFPMPFYHSCAVNKLKLFPMAVEYCVLKRRSLIRSSTAWPLRQSNRWNETNSNLLKRNKFRLDLMASLWRS